MLALIWDQFPVAASKCRIRRSACDVCERNGGGFKRPASFFCTFVTRYERFGPALERRGDHGAEPMRQDVLRVVVDVFPAVSAGLQETTGTDTSSVSKHQRIEASSAPLTLSAVSCWPSWSQSVSAAVK